MYCKWKVTYWAGYTLKSVVIEYSDIYNLPNNMSCTGDLGGYIHQILSIERLPE